MLRQDHRAMGKFLGGFAHIGGGPLQQLIQIFRGLRKDLQQLLEPANARLGQLMQAVARLRQNALQMRDDRIAGIGQIAQPMGQFAQGPAIFAQFRADDHRIHPRQANFLRDAAQRGLVAQDHAKPLLHRARPRFERGKALVVHLQAFGQPLAGVVGGGLGQECIAGDRSRRRARQHRAGVLAQGAQRIQGLRQLALGGAQRPLLERQCQMRQRFHPGVLLRHGLAQRVFGPFQTLARGIADLQRHNQLPHLRLDLLRLACQLGRGLLNIALAVVHILRHAGEALDRGKDGLG